MVLIRCNHFSPTGIKKAIRVVVLGRIFRKTLWIGSNKKVRLGSIGWVYCLFDEKTNRNTSIMEITAIGLRIQKRYAAF